MRQISASKRSQNVVEIAKTDYCGFGQMFLVIVPHPSIYLYSQKPANYDSQQVLTVPSLIEEVTVSFLIR